MGFSVSGRLTPEMVKPVPATVAALTVTAAAPVEVSVKGSVAVECTFTLPKTRLLVLSVSEMAAAPSCRLVALVMPPALADTVTDWATLTAETVAGKLALLAPPATVTVDGTFTAPLLLDRLMRRPALSAAEFSATVQVSVPAPVIDV